jgi:CRISPR-associated protein Csd1
MILQALASYYEALSKRGDSVSPGWAVTKVSYALEIGGDGSLLQIHSLKQADSSVKKALPREMVLPSIGEAKGSGIKSNFTWEGSAYLLGVSAKGKPDRIRQCFEAAKQLHLALLSESGDPFAQAICRYFTSWCPDSALENPEIRENLDELSSSNLVFMFGGSFPRDSEAISGAWQRYYESLEEGEKLPCLVTGRPVVPAALHPPIKGVWGTNSNKAALVSFNAPAYCSYNREQNLNAPVGKYAAFAYTTALNKLLSEKEHVKRIGHTTLVYWAEDGEPAYQDAFSFFLDGGDADGRMTDKDLDYCVSAISRGRRVDWNGTSLKPENRFYVLGLAPNVSRLSVRFFLRDGFGGFVGHIREHYAGLSIVGPPAGRAEKPQPAEAYE